MFGLRVEPQPKIDRFYEQDQTIGFGEYEITRPPHARPLSRRRLPGREEAGPQGPQRTATLFVGDTLFAGSIGRTDLPGGDTGTLLRSIREVLFTFPDDTPVYSGHGEVTTIGREKRTNPFLHVACRPVASGS